MPTNDERREVAVKLRDMACRTNPSWPALMEALGCPGRAVAVQYLADLIEPEERTCRNTVGKPFAGYRMFSCSECGAYLEVDGDTDANLFAGGERPMPRYCPNCGAKVVQE